MRHLKTGIGRIPAAVVEKISDIVSPEDINQPLVLGAIFLEAFQFVAAGTKRARWGCLECRDGAFALLAGIDQVFCQGADNAVSSGKDFPDLLAVLARRFNDATGAGVNHGSHAA